MKKLINDPNKAAAELIDGLVVAYNGAVKKVGKASVVKTDIKKGKVALLVGGGAGHEPIYHGLVGDNMADGAACGDIFAAPPPNIVLDATEAIDQGNGVLYLYGNYAGDVMNFGLGADFADDEDIEVETVLIADDVASAPLTEKGNRRGIAGLVPVVKLAGAASNVVDSLAELKRIAQKANDMTRTIGVALAPGSIPATGAPTFELAEDEIGFGIGMHGERGIGTEKMQPADDITEMLLKYIFADDLEFEQGCDVVLFVNSLGATTMMECLIVLRKCKEILAEKGINIYDVIVGPIVTCQEMAGVSVTLTKLDDELKQYWDMPAASLGYTKN